MSAALRVAIGGFVVGAAIHPSVAGAQKLGWGGAVEASGNVLFGAARGRLISLSGGAQRADSTLEFHGDVRLSYADARTEDDAREVTARSSRLSLGIDHRPFARLSPFWLGSAESSLQQRVDRRYSTGAGAKLTFWRQDEDDVSASLALLWEHTRALDPDAATSPRSTRTRWSLRLRVRRQLTESLHLSHVTFYQPVVDRLSRYTAESTTSIAVAINRRVALTASLRDRYDSEARSRGALSNHDGQVLFGARTSF